MDEIGKILRAHLVRIRRHRIRRHYLEFTKARFLKGSELIGGVDELHTESILVEDSSRDRFSVASHQADGAVLGVNILAGCYQGGMYLVGGSSSPNTGQVRSNIGAYVANTVT